jgi:hypothetical protein
MKIFVSYAAEDRARGERIALALRGSDHTVFFDRDTLPKGDAYHRAIREAIERSDLLVFLISPHSLEKGSYCLSELKHARDRWPHPRNRVLPVMIQEVDWTSVPPYISELTVLYPEGNVAAEVEAEVSRISAVQAPAASNNAIPIIDREDAVNLDRLTNRLASIILSNIGGEHLGTHLSERVAREKGYALYDTLRRTADKTDVFVGALERLSVPTTRNHETGVQVEKAAADLTLELKRLLQDLGAVNPQLEIHRHELVRDLLDYHEFRLRVLSELEHATQFGAQLLTITPELLEKARANQRLIHRCVEDARDFLRHEFSFSQSF